MANQTEMLQQFIHLAPILEKSIACLDAPVTSLLLLETAILSRSHNHSNMDVVFPAVTASLRYQTATLIDVFTFNKSLDFQCHHTQCAASTLAALLVYGQSKTAADAIVHTVTDPLLKLLQCQQGSIHIGDTKTRTRKNSKKQGSCRKIFKVDSNKMSDYIKDMTTIVDIVCRRSHDYCSGESSLTKRLNFMKSPLDKIISLLRGREEGQEDSRSAPAMATVLDEVQRQDSTLNWFTAMDLLLVLLSISSVSEEKNSRKSIVELLTIAVEHVGAVTFLEKLESRGWNKVLTAEELLTSFLMRQKFRQAIKSVSPQARSSAAVGVLAQVFVDCAFSRNEYVCSDIYAAARDLEMIGCLVRAALSDDCGLKQKAPYSLLFHLVHGAGVAASQRFQVGIEAVRRWQQQFDSDRPRQFSIPTTLDGSYLGFDDHIPVVGLLRLAALAVFIDKEPLMTRGKAKLVRLSAVENLLTVLTQDWIDPLLAYILLIEVSILSHYEWEAVASLATECNPSTWESSTLMEILTKQQEFIQRPNAVNQVRDFCGSYTLARDLACKCKATLAAFITNSKQLADNSSGSCGVFVNIGNYELPSRSVCLRDFIVLEHLCQVYPDEEICFENLLHNPLQELGRTEEFYKYRSVVEKFQKFRRRRDGQLEGDKPGEAADSVSRMEGLDVERMIRVYGGPTVITSRFPFYAHYSDDPEDLY